MNQSVIGKSTDPAIRRYRRAFAARDDNLHAWARANHFPYETVRTAILRWGDRPDTPRGGKTSDVMAKLDTYFGGRLVPQKRRPTQEPQ